MDCHQSEEGHVFSSCLSDFDGHVSHVVGLKPTENVFEPHGGHCGICDRSVDVCDGVRAWNNQTGGSSLCGTCISVG